MIRRTLIALSLLLVACTGDEAEIAGAVGPRATVAPGSAMSMLGPGQAAPGATAAADDHGDAHHSATALTLGEAAAGRASTVEDPDVFAIDLPLGVHTVSVSSFGEVGLVVYAADGVTELARSAGAELQLDVTQAGRHYVRVQASAGRDLDYNLVVE